MKKHTIGCLICLLNIAYKLQAQKVKYVVVISANAEWWALKKIWANEQ